MYKLASQPPLYILLRKPNRISDTLRCSQTTGHHFSEHILKFYVPQTDKQRHFSFQHNDRLVLRYENT